MILKRLINLSLKANTKHPTTLSYLFSNDNVQQKQIQQGDIAEEPEGNWPKKRQWNNSKNQYRNNYQNNSKFYSREKTAKSRTIQMRGHDYQKIVGPILLNKVKDLNNLEQVQQVLRQPKKMNEKLQEIEELKARAASSNAKLLADYQYKLGLNLQYFINNKTFLDFDKLEKLSKRPVARINLNQSIDIDQIKKLYSQNVFIKNSKYFCENILQYVIKNPRHSFLLNLFYRLVKNQEIYDQKYRQTQKQGQEQGHELQLGKDKIQQVVELIASGILQQASPLKFYWLAEKIDSLDPSTRNFMLQQFNKLTLNEVNIHKQLQSVTYFYLGQQLSAQILSAIIKNSNTVQQTIMRWFLTIAMVGRIRKYQESNQNIQKINFHDILQFATQDADFYVFLKEQLPNVLLNAKKQKLLDIYKYVMFKKQESHHQPYNISVKSPQSIFDKQMRHEIKLQYSFQKDPQKITVKLLSDRQKSFTFKGYDLITSIIKGQYSKGLQFYEESMSQNLNKLQQIASLKKKAAFQFQHQDSQALFVLRQMFRQGKVQTKFSQLNLTQSMLTSFMQFSNKKFYESNKQRNSPKNYDQEQKSQQIQNKKIFQRHGGQGPKRQNWVKAQRWQNQNKRTPRQNERVDFLKKRKQGFSTRKTDFEFQQNNQNSDEQYENYLRIVKQIEQKAKEIELQSEESKKLQVYNFNNCQSAEDVETEFKKHIGLIKRENIKIFINKFSNIPFVNNMKSLIKYFFLNGSISELVPEGLLIQFKSSQGDIQKNYGEYLKGCAFMFQLPRQIYQQLLKSQLAQFHRKKFKKIVAHMLLFKQDFSSFEVSTICEICTKNKIGLTLLEIANLMNARKISITKQSLKYIAQSIQHFKNMEFELLEFIKKHCAQNQMQVQTYFFAPYIINLVQTERYQALNNFLQLLRKQLKSKQFKLNPQLSASEFLNEQKIFKQKQQLTENKEIFEMLKTISKSFKPRTTIPEFIPEMFQLYASRKNQPLNAEQYAVGLIINSQNQMKFLDLLDKIKENRKQNTIVVLEAAMKSLLIFGRNIKGFTDKILSSTLLQKEYNLTEAQLKQFGYIFKQIDAPGSFITYLEYLLKKQPTISQETKGLYYRVFNSTTDDSSRNQISSLLDFLFNPSREKERIEYKSIKVQQERKKKILQKMIQPQKKVAKQQVKKQENKQKEVSQKSAQKKKLKKQEKKALKEQKMKNKSTDDLIQSEKQKKKTEMRPEYEKLNKTLVKQLIKSRSSLSYDQTNKIIFSSKLWLRDTRTEGVNQFIEGFMGRYQLSTPQQTEKVGKQAKKGKQVKQGEKEKQKKTPKKQVKK